MKGITTNGITILLVEVPEDAKEQWILNGFIHVGELQDDAFSIKLPSGQYQILGKSTELSEEQMKEICEKHPDSTFVHPIYNDYVKDGQFTKGDGFTSLVLGYDNPGQSYLSLLEANGIVDRNPYELPESGRDKLYDSSETHGRSQVYHEEWHKRMKQWQEAQSKVKHYLVLKKNV